MTTTSTKIPLSLTQQSLLVISIEDHLCRLPEGAPFHQELKRLLRLAADTVGLEVEEMSPLEDFFSLPDEQMPAEAMGLVMESATL